MTEWNASAYHEHSSLQRWVAAESLAALDLGGGERVLDVGCGDGRITAEIARRVPRGSVVGVDPSAQMIEFARAHCSEPSAANLRFEVGDARSLPFRDAFDLVVSFNALHWVTDQEAALGSIRDALAPSGRAFLQLVSRGARRSLEDVIDETRRSPAWSGYFHGYLAPYVHFTPAQYRELARQNGLQVERLEVRLESWDFRTREAFVAFARATFVEWTRMIPAERQLAFIDDVLDAYRRLGDGSEAEAHVFHFYQMRVVLRRR